MTDHGPAHTSPSAFTDLTIRLTEIEALAVVRCIQGVETEADRMTLVRVRGKIEAAAVEQAKGRRR